MSADLRYYDPIAARFLTRDPINALTRSAYGYVEGGPLNANDPSGPYCLSGVNKEASERAGQEVCNGPGDVVDSLVPDSLRPPDYITIDAGFFFPLGEIPAGPGGGLNVTITKSGDVFVGPEVGVGIAGPSLGVKGGWIDTTDEPCDEEINRFADGAFVSAGGGGYVQGGVTVNGSGQTATELGFGTPGASGQVGYSWQPFSLPFGLGY